MKKDNDYQDIVTRFEHNLERLYITRNEHYKALEEFHDVTKPYIKLLRYFGKIVLHKGNPEEQNDARELLDILDKEG